MNIAGGYRFIQKIGLAFKRLARSFVPTQRHRTFQRSHGSTAGQIAAIYVINLDRQASRWKQFMAEAQRQRTENGERLFDFCRRVTAVDGKLLNEAQENDTVAKTYPLDAQYYVDPDPRLLTLIRDEAINVSMSREEIAVALSHIKSWRSIVEDNCSYALILEDDVFFESEFAAQLNRTWQELPQGPDGCPSFDVLYLSFREVERGAQRVACSPNLFRPHRGYWWLSGYVLSQSGANKLLEQLPVIGPVDLWMNYRFAEMDIYSTPRSVISQRTDVQSDNCYSILPLLSQIGIQTDRSHLILEQAKGRQPVFGIGFDRESAAILESALSLLSYRCCNDRWGLLSDTVKELLDGNRPLLFDAYIHTTSVSHAFAKVRELYPAAVFIMPPAARAGSEISSAEYCKLRTGFAGHAENLLLLDVHHPSPWRSLCTFLDCEQPAHSFPKARDSSNLFALLDGSIPRLSISDRPFIVQQHDVHPWIVPYERMADFGVLRESRKWGARAGVFSSIGSDDFICLDQAKWKALEDSFPSNLATFRRENITLLSPQGCRLTLAKRKTGDRAYTAASIVSNDFYRYGRFEVTMKPVRTPGVVSAFFLHRNDPWQEIDVELVGLDTTKLLVNVYFNPGDANTKCNFGNRGTPVIIDLGFDAAESYHRFAIEWEPHELRWFVDDELIHVRGLWEPTPIPNLPMQLHCSIWPPRSVELAGELIDEVLPVWSDIKCVEILKWSAESHVMSPSKKTTPIQNGAIVFP